MQTIVVVGRKTDWTPKLEGVELVLASDYLTDPSWSERRNVRMFNLCRSYRYQSEGYYVSLLAVARRHRPFPELMTVLEMKSRSVVRDVDEELDALIQKSLGDLRAPTFQLSVYFGKNLAKRHERLARALFARFPAPLLRARFQRGERWRLTSIAPIGFRDVPASHRDFLHDAARDYFAKPRFRARSKKTFGYDLAILHDPKEELAPSDPKALRRMARAAEKVGFAVEFLERDDYGRLGEFDALFLRETTRVDHHTFRFAQRAEALGLAVIDDPVSILRCTNKVFQTEAFHNRDVPTPRTWITDRVDAAEIERRVGFPCVLKIPDSAFSQGVVKCRDAEELAREGARIMAATDLLLVQEYLPSDYDWRIGVLAGEPLYACRYHMAQGHWQIVKRAASGKIRYGRTDTLPLAEAPAFVLDAAVRAAAAMGDGLYGVDLKQVEQRALVIEVNDNPNLTAGDEDKVLGEELYLRLMRVFLQRVEAKKRGSVA
ncbi:MAG: RimK family protein [Planctomycetota bacterium]